MIRCWTWSATPALCSSARRRTGRTSSTTSAPRSPSDSSRRRASPPSRPRPIGRMPTASTATSGGRAMMPSRWKRSPTSGDSPPGCGATLTWSSSSSGCARVTTRVRPRPPRPASTVWISIASTPRWRPCSDSSRRSTPRPRRRRARAMPVSIISARIPRSMASPPGGASPNRARTRWSPSSSSSNAAPWSTRDGMVARRRRRPSTPSRTPAW